MKTAQFSILMLLSLGTLAFNTYAQEYMHLNLPEGAVARLGKGSLNAVQYSPDGSRLAVATSIGIWLYDIGSHREIALFAGHPDVVNSVAFNPTSGVLASGSDDGTVLLWKVTD